MPSLVSDHLISTVNSMANVIAPILRERRKLTQFTKTESDILKGQNELLVRHGPQVFATLAVTSSYLTAIGSGLYFCDKKGAARATQAFSDFIRFAIRLYQEHLHGYEDCDFLSNDDADDCSDCTIMLGNYATSAEPFGFKCDYTGAGVLGWMLAVEMDVFLGGHTLLETLISTRKEITDTIIAVTNANELASERQIKAYEKSTSQFRKWASDLCSQRAIRNDLPGLADRIIQ